MYYAFQSTTPFQSPQIGSSQWPQNVFGSTFANPYGVSPVQQIQQLLQIVPQQLQYLLQLSYWQQHQLQQILHIVPAQLQQLIQLVPQIQQQQQTSPFQQPFGPAVGLGAFGTPPPFGLSPQIFGAQSSHVM